MLYPLVSKKKSFRLNFYYVLAIYIIKFLFYSIYLADLLLYIKASIHQS